MKHNFRLHHAPKKKSTLIGLILKPRILIALASIIGIYVVFTAILSSEESAPHIEERNQTTKISLDIPTAPDKSGSPNTTNNSTSSKIKPLVGKETGAIKPLAADETSKVKPLPLPTDAALNTDTGKVSISLALPEPIAKPDKTENKRHSRAVQGKWLEETVSSGDSLALIFSRLGLSPRLLHKIVNSSSEAKGLTNIRPGESIRIHLNDKGQLLKLIYARNAIESLHITPNGDSFSARTETKEVEKRLGYKSGTIVSSFYLSAQKAGLSDGLIMDLATIFGWDIDFALEIRKGDSFSVVFEESYLNDTRHGNGRILAAEFINQGKAYRAIRYDKKNGDYDYYSPDGKSMRKAFLRAPVDFRRISSRFTKERYHPVLGKKRPHRGVDYAASTGTPIKAAGDGRVIFRGTKGGYGRTVIIKHGSQYTTLYAHMSRYRSKVKRGTKVRQGQTIGYVGKSGLATGPHLHYEFRVNGRHRNPLTVKLPASAPIEKSHKGDFLKHSKRMSSTLDLLSRAMLAKTEKK